MSRPFLLGLTGSIGMGKSTTAAIFAEAGVPVWDADATVHALYAPGGAAVAAIAALFPDAIRDGAVDRDRLKAHIAWDDAALSRIEGAVHPLVAAHRAAFVAAARAIGAPLVLLDIPLLFETGADRTVDAIAVVSAPADVQRARVLARPGMTEAQFKLILSRQTKDADKRARATYVIDTRTPESAQRDVRKILEDLKAPHA